MAIISITSLPRNCWPPILQYLSPAERGRFAQTCKGHERYFSPLRSLLSDRIYPDDLQRLEQWGSVVERELEHPLNTSAQKAGAALYISAGKGDLLFVRKLLSTRPDIRSSDKERALSIAGIAGRHRVVRELMIHRSPQLSRCKDIHEMMNELFPPQRENPTFANRPSVDPIYDELRKTPVRLEEEPYDYRRHSTVQVALRTLILRFFALNHYNTKEGGVNFTLDTLANVHPLFGKVWESANRSQRLEIKEVTKEAALQNGASDVHEKGQYACYNPVSHSIEVDHDSPPAQTVDMLFFEIMNALQREIFQKIFDLAGAGELNREEFATLIEFVEYRSGDWRTRMLGYMHQKQALCTPFAQVWKGVNTPNFPGATPHADHYRHHWDKEYFGRYLATHQGMIFSQPPQTPSSLLDRAAADGDVTEVMDLLKKHPDLNEWDVVGVSLSTAAQRGYLEVIECMLSLRKDLSQESIGIALVAAASHRHWKVVRYLLQHCPEMSSKDTEYALRKVEETGNSLLIQDIQNVFKASRERLVHRALPDASEPA